MNRQSLTFDCSGHPLAGTLDAAPGTAGLLIVSGGNEIRAGTCSNQSRLAARIAEAGFPVFRFDRRGIGDSDGENRGFRNSRKDIAAAIATFRALSPQMERIIAYGNCDGASALMLSQGEGCDVLILSNPWTVEGNMNATAPPAAIRSGYIEKLKNPKNWLRLINGTVNLRTLFSELRHAISTEKKTTSLALKMAAGIECFGGEIQFLLATRDQTAHVFEANWPTDNDPRIRRCKGAGHAYVEAHASLWLEEQILEALNT